MFEFCLVEADENWGEFHCGCGIWVVENDEHRAELCVIHFREYQSMVDGWILLGSSLKTWTRAIKAQQDEIERRTACLTEETR